MHTRFEVLEASCTACGLCQERAPENMEMPAGARSARVIGQPRNDEEEEACIEAAEYCPIGAIRVVTPESPAERPAPTAVAATPSA